MPFLHSREWMFSAEFLEEFENVPFGDYSSTEVMHEAMRLLHKSLSSRVVYQFARELCDANPPWTPSCPEYGYSENDLKRFLLDGDYNVNGLGTGNGVLEIDVVPLDLRHSVAGLAMPDQNSIGINWEFFANDARFADELYPNDRIGMTRLSWEIASIVLHEVVHRHRFMHPGLSDLATEFHGFSIEVPRANPRSMYPALP